MFEVGCGVDVSFSATHAIVTHSLHPGQLWVSVLIAVRYKRSNEPWKKVLKNEMKI